MDTMTMTKKAAGAKGARKQITLAEELRRWREQMAKAAGLEASENDRARGVIPFTQEMAATLLGLSPDTWANWEQNRRKPSALSLVSLRAMMRQKLEDARGATA